MSFDEIAASFEADCNEASGQFEPSNSSWYCQESNFEEPDGPEFSFTDDLALPSDGGEPAFRLLELLPGEPSDSVRCTLRVVQLKEAPTFQALSYSWGGEINLKGIYINDCVHRVTSNLRSALRHLRKRTGTGSRLLWVDAVCIRQDNLDEKGSQIGMMGQFYRASTKTIIWIGPASPRSHLALRRCQISARAKEAESQCLENSEWKNEMRRRVKSYLLRTTGSSYNNYVLCLLQRSWFSRAWVCQEAILSPSSELYCGFTVLNWNVFVRGVFHGFEARHILGGTTILRMTDRPSARKYIPMRIKGELNQMTPADGLLHYLMEFRYQQAKEPVDKIYSILGLVDARRIGIQVNPGLSWQEVYRNATAQIIMHTDHLDVLGASNRETNALSLSPSWVADWRRESISVEAFRQASAADTNGQSATKTSSSTARFSDDLSILFLSGYAIGSIESVSTVLPIRTAAEASRSSELDLANDFDRPDRHTSVKTAFKKMPSRLRRFKEQTRTDTSCIFININTILNWERFAGIDETGETPSSSSNSDGSTSSGDATEYWHTLCAGRFLNGNKATTEKEFWILYHALARNRALFKLPFTLETSQILATTVYISSTLASTPKFLETMRLAVGRRLAKVRLHFNGEYRVALALVPPGADEGDSVVLCCGGAVPLIARRRVDNADEAWTLLGEAYVHGIMQGSAFKEELCEKMVFQ